MSRRTFIGLLTVLASYSIAQEGITEQLIEPAGGKAEFNQVLETQLALPEILLTKSFAADVKVHFALDSAGKADELLFEGTENNVLRKELARIMKFYSFSPHVLPYPLEQPYYVVFTLSTSRYNKYLKQRSRTKIKTIDRTDSSLVIVSRADRSPAYYKNDETGLTEYILSEITYPNVAREQSVQGTVVLEFVVETNGFVTSIVPKKSVGAGCTEEAIRLISETRWQPALLGGKAVRYKMNYPITFSLRSAAQGGMQPAATVGN